MIIAHRMRTIAGADKIVVIKNGKSDEQGTPEELKQQNGFYKKMVTIQNNKTIVYLHKRNFEISNSRHADERNTNWSYAMLSRDTKNAS